MDVCNNSPGSQQQLSSYFSNQQNIQQQSFASGYNQFGGADFNGPVQCVADQTTVTRNELAGQPHGQANWSEPKSDYHNLASCGANNPSADYAAASYDQHSLNQCYFNENYTNRYSYQGQQTYQSPQQYQNLYNQQTFNSQPDYSGQYHYSGNYYEQPNEANPSHNNGNTINIQLNKIDIYPQYDNNYNLLEATRRLNGTKNGPNQADFSGSKSAPQNQSGCWSAQPTSIPSTNHQVIDNNDFTWITPAEQQDSSVKPTSTLTKSHSPRQSTAPVKSNSNSNKSLAAAPRSNQCDVCGRNYARPSTLKTHLRTHTNERPFKCTVCSKTFSQAANLTAHQRVHTGERPFSCPICGRQFSQSSSVITHLRTHSGERPYRCGMCNRTFSDSSTLTKHCRIHSGEKPYQCEFCPLNFSQSGNLSRHLKLHSPGVDSTLNQTAPTSPVFGAT